MWEISVAFLGISSNHSNNYDEERFGAFFCWWSQSNDKLWASRKSSEDEFLIYGSIKGGTYTRKGKSTEGVAAGEKLSQQRGQLQISVTWIPRLEFSPDHQLLSQPCVSQTPALHLLQKRTLVALAWPVPSGSWRSQDWLLRALAGSDTGCALPLVNSQTPESWDYLQRGTSSKRN